MVASYSSVTKSWKTHLYIDWGRGKYFIKGEKILESYVGLRGGPTEQQNISPLAKSRVEGIVAVRWFIVNVLRSWLEVKVFTGCLHWSG